MQGINNFKNIQDLGTKGAKVSPDGNVNNLELLEQGLFGPQGKNEFQAELAKNIDLSQLQTPVAQAPIAQPGTQPHLLLGETLDPELAQGLNQAQGLNEQVEVLPPTIRRSGLISHNAEPKSIFINQPKAEVDQFLINQNELGQELPVLNTGKPKSIFLNGDFAAQVEGQKVQKGAQNFVHKSMLDVNKAKMDTPVNNLAVQTSDSENLINLRNMMNKTNTKALNGAHFDKSGNTGLINMNAVNESENFEDESFSGDTNGNDFLSSEQFASKDIELAPTGKVFETSSLDGMDSTDTEALINKISDYIQNSKIDNSKRVEMSMNDQHLGKIDLVVEKSANNTINVSMSTANSDVSALLNQNKSQLISNLSQSGFTVNDVKIDISSSRSNSNSNFSQNFSGNQNQSQQFGSKNGQQNQDSQKRNDLWDILRDKEAA